MPKFKIILVLFLYFSSALFPIRLSAQSLPQGDFSELRETGTAQVLQVITPLTLKLSNGDIIRLSGLHLTDYTPDNAGPFALTALKVLQDMLEGENVRIYQTKKKDVGRTNRMGHKLAHLVRKRDGVWAQGTLIGLGLAQVKTSQRTPEMAAQLYALETAARTEKQDCGRNIQS